MDGSDASPPPTNPQQKYRGFVHLYSINVKLGYWEKIKFVL